HIAHGAHDRPAVGDIRRLTTSCNCCLYLWPGEFSQTKVKDLDSAVLRDKQVFRLKIAVYDAFTMGGCESLGDLDCVIHSLPYCQWPPSNVLAQCQPFQELGHQIGSSFVSPHLKHRHNVGVVQC